MLAFGLPKIDESFPGVQRGHLTALVGHRVCRAFSFLLGVRCQLPIRKGGMNCRAIYVDGGNTFDPYRVSAIAQKHRLEPRCVLEKILISRAFTSYQLTAVIFEKLEEALKKYRSKLVIIADAMGLFLDKDLPVTEGRDVFMKMTEYLSELAATRRIIIVVTCSRQRDLGRSIFLRSVLLERANTVIGFRKSRGVLRFAVERHPSLMSLVVDLPSNLVTMDRFVEA